MLRVLWMLALNNWHEYEGRISIMLSCGSSNGALMAKGGEDCWLGQLLSGIGLSLVEEEHASEESMGTSSFCVSLPRTV
jgi:hypothetical protein